MSACPTDSGFDDTLLAAFIAIDSMRENLPDLFGTQVHLLRYRK
jgi:hypothetical protein